jgi:hypothetical protein
MTNGTVNDAFAARLEELGYFRGLSADQALALKRDFDQKGWPAIFSKSHRFYRADAEDLAEGGIGKFLRKVEPFLAAQGVRLPEIADETSEDGYVVRVGGLAHRIFDGEEMKRDLSGGELGLIWGLSAARGFRIANQMLAAAGSDERVFALNGGNDLFAMFLTPALHEVIIQHPNASRRDNPYALTEEYPSFGSYEED